MRCSPGTCGGRSCGGRRTTTTTSGGEGRVLVEEGDAEVAGVLGLRKSAPGTPVEVIRGLKEPAVHRRQGITAAAVLTGGGLREEIRTEERAEVAGEGC
jgi:hypothetical protein